MRHQRWVSDEADDTTPWTTTITTALAVVVRCLVLFLADHFGG
jgi:hypothetical protein